MVLPWSKASSISGCLNIAVAELQDKYPQEPALPVLVRPDLRSCAQVCATQFWKGIEGLDCVQRRTMELEKGVEHSFYEEELRELGA